MNLILKMILLCFLFVPHILFSSCEWKKNYAWAPYLGPEIYYMKRTKEGGVHQTGALYGVRLGYDYIRRNFLYWGVEGYWARGTLEDHCERENLKSRFTDCNGEVRLGFTFQCRGYRYASIIPYIGFGYLIEKNNFINPTPLKVHFKNTISYVPFGFLSQIFISPDWSIGFNFKVRWIIDGRQRVTHDPENDHVTQHYEEKLQYRAELPISYFFCFKKFPWGLSLVPFFEYRHYGHKANFPFDFLDTKIKICGATLKLMLLF